MRITNFDKFREVVAKARKTENKALLEYLAFSRIVCELTLVDIFNSCRKNSDVVPKSETLDDYANMLEGERILIIVLGRREAAKVYGAMEGITSDVKMVDFILKEDSVQYYKELISKE